VPDAFLNPNVRRDEAYRGLFEDEEYGRVHAFYDAHPGAPPTPLRPLHALAARLSLAGLHLKDESARFGLGAFKITGARYAIHTVGRAALSHGIVCATAGNHGRAVARAAKDIGVPCTVFLPAAHERASDLERRIRASRVEGMRQDGARTIDAAGTYEDAVAEAADYARRTGAQVISDTSWSGHEEIPRLIMLGYTRLFDEASLQWPRVPDIVIVQGGVGGLVCAAANWFAWRFGARRPYLIACEPESAACLLESARAGRAVTLTTDPASDSERPAPSAQRPAPSAQRAGLTMMAGLRCAEPSPAAWPSIQSGIDAFVSIPDSCALEAIERLREPEPGDPAIAAGPSGACGVGALLALLSSPQLAAVREACSPGVSTHVMAVVTEGP
jgi:diaminopropionate ammonia-lyase